YSLFFFFSSRRRHTRSKRDWSSDVCSSDLALDSVRLKGESLGFRLVGHVDSPVAGGSGTVEILAHLVFDGRSEKLPQLGESRARSEERRVGKEGRWRWETVEGEKKKEE